MTATNVGIEYRLSHLPSTAQIEASWKTRHAHVPFRVKFRAVSESGIMTYPKVAIMTYDHNEMDQTVVFTGLADSHRLGPSGKVSAIIYLADPDKSYMLTIWV